MLQTRMVGCRVPTLDKPSFTLLNFSPWQVVGSFNVFWMEQFVDHPKTGVKNWRQIATVPFLKHSTAVYGTLSSALGLLRAVEMPSAASAGEPWHETETRVP